MAISAGINLAARRTKLMQILQRESGRVVVPRRSPVCSGVAAGTLRCRESRRSVIRHRATESCRAFPFRLMATIAIGIGRGEIVVVVHVTIRAGRCAVNPGQRPSRGAVIKRRGRPSDCIVAGRAIRRCERSARSLVSGIVGLLPGCEVTPRISAVVRLD